MANRSLEDDTWCAPDPSSAGAATSHPADFDEEIIPPPPPPPRIDYWRGAGDERSDATVRAATPVRIPIDPSGENNQEGEDAEQRGKR
jgi:hypothetical protein